MKHTPQQPAARTIVIRDIANYCQVSVCTVSRALQHDPRVAAATTARVLAAAERLGYSPNVAARHLAMQRFHRQPLSRLMLLSLPMHFYRARFFSDLFRGVLEVADTQEFSVMVSMHLGADAARDAWQAMPPGITRQAIDGLIVFASITEQDFITQLRRHPRFGARPIISVMGDHADCSSVVADEKAGAYAATRHLLQLGHRHILCFVHAVESLSLHARLNGVSLAMAEAGRDPARYLHRIQMPHGWGDPDADARLTDCSPAPSPSHAHFLRYLDAHPEVTAMLALNDANARHACFALHTLGKRVPDDMSIIGFDDTDPLLDAQGQNLLTTVRVPLLEIGRRAAQLLIDHLTDAESAAASVTLPTELIVRRTTAPPGLPAE